MGGQEMHEKTGEMPGSGHEKTCAWCHLPLGRGHGLVCALWCASKTLGLLGVIALIAAWVTDYQASTWLGFGSDHLFHDAIALLVLAVMFKVKVALIRQRMVMEKMKWMMTESGGRACMCAPGEQSGCACSHGGGCGSGCGSCC